jgi:cysteine sulfinate desulfinase/cysteine desulfurase-like protein
MGLDDEAARSAVLVTAGPGTTQAEVQEAVSAYAQSVAALRAMAPS